MSLRRVRQRLDALREDAERHAGRDWITVRVPEHAPDEKIASWLSSTIGPDWRRNVIVRFDDAHADGMAVVGRFPIARDPEPLWLRFSAADAALC